MTIYLAGSWTQKSAVRYARGKFQAAGIKVQSDWIDSPDEAGHVELRASAYRDLQQLHGADALVIMSVERSEGKASEFMFAYCAGKPIVVVGNHDLNIFYHLDKVTLVNTIQEAIDSLHQLVEVKLDALRHG